MKNYVDCVRAVIRATGATLCEVLAIRREDIIRDKFGNMYILIGAGRKRRAVLIVDKNIIEMLAEEAKAEDRSELFEDAVKNFDPMTDRAEYAKRLYALVSAGSECVLRGPTTYKEGYAPYFEKREPTDEYALHIVARTMGVDTPELKKLLKS